jgi:hypothetical protein
VGKATGAQSNGVWGSGGYLGVGGASSLADGIGVQGSCGAAGGYAVEGLQGTCTYAGYFPGTLYYDTLVQGSSDIRLKKNVQPLQGAIDRLLQLRGVTFEWKDPAERGGQTGTQRGFIAQDVEKVMPEWSGPPDEKGFKTIAVPGHAFDALVVESLRSLKTENDELRDRVNALEANRRPVASGFGMGAGILGLAAIGGAFVISRRKRTDART